MTTLGKWHSVSLLRSLAVTVGLALLLSGCQEPESFDDRQSRIMRNFNFWADFTLRSPSSGNTLRPGPIYLHSLPSFGDRLSVLSNPLGDADLIVDCATSLCLRTEFGDITLVPTYGTDGGVVAWSTSDGSQIYYNNFLYRLSGNIPLVWYQEWSDRPKAMNMGNRILFGQ